MDYSKRTVTSRPGLSQEEALDSLQDAPFYSTGTKIASFRRRGTTWVADLRIPKEAGPFPPSDDEPSEDKPSDEGPPKPPFGDSDSDDSGADEAETDSGPSESDGPPSSSDGKKKEKGGDGEMLSLLHQILQGLTDAGIVQPHPADMGLAGHDDLGPGPEGLDGPPPAGPEGGPGPGRPPKKPGAMDGPGGMGAKLRPGEMRNTPGATPVGAPAFASTRQSVSTPMGPSPSVPQPEMAGQAMQPGACPPGQQTVNGQCQPIQTPGAANPIATGNGVVGRVASFTASTGDNISVKEAKSELENLYSQHGYKVKQIKREGGQIHALLSVR